MRQADSMPIVALSAALVLMALSEQRVRRPLAQKVAESRIERRVDKSREPLAVRRSLVSRPLEGTRRPRCSPVLMRHANEIRNDRR
jgi:hypothetical protein